MRGRIAGGERSLWPPLDPAFIDEVLNNPDALSNSGLPLVTSTSDVLTRPLDRIYECLGSTTNPQSLILLQKEVNILKGGIYAGKNPFDIQLFKDNLRDFIKGSKDSSAFLDLLFKVSFLVDAEVHSLDSHAMIEAYDIRVAILGTHAILYQCLTILCSLDLQHLRLDAGPWPSLLAQLYTCGRF